MKRLKIQIDSKYKLVTYKKVDSKIYVHCEGQSIVIEQNIKKKKITNKQDTVNDKNIYSTMPGQITQLLVKLNQKVKKGDLLLSMEAMKMEYNFFAKADAKIISVNCKIDDNIKAEQILLQLEYNDDTK